MKIPEDEILKNGTHIGDAEGDRETKYMGWSVYFYKGNLYAFITERGDTYDYDTLTEGALTLYVDDLESAQKKLEEAKEKEAAQ